MITGFPLLMLTLPLVAALAALALGRWPRLAIAAGVVVLLALSVLLAFASTDSAGGAMANTSAAYGVQLVLTPGVRRLFLYIYPALALLLTLVWFQQTGRALVPAGLAMLSPLAAALMITPPGLGAALMSAAVALLAPALYAGRYEAAAAAWRWFLMVVLGLLALIWLSWLQTSGSAANPVLPLLLATLLLLGGLPFHIWVRPLARTASLPALALAVGLAQLGLVVLLLAALDAAPVARSSVEFQTAVRGSIALTALLGAFLMVRAREWRGLVAAALLLDGGFLITSGLAPGASGLTLALTALISRTLGLLLIAVGLNLPARHRRSLWRDGPEVGQALLVYGCLSLVGLPLTPGFVARWAQVAQLAPATLGEGAAGSLLPLLAVGVGGLALARLAARSGSGQPEAAEHGAVGRGEWLLAVGLLVLAALLGLLPGLLAGFAGWLAGL